MTKNVRAHVIITGNVQGVYFRATASEEARLLGLTGWIRNDPDGSVEAIFEGPEEKVKLMIEWCEEGPELAKVENVKVMHEEYTGEFRNFIRK